MPVDFFLPLVYGYCKVPCLIPFFQDDYTTHRAKFIGVIGEGEIDAIEKVWVDDYLVYDNGSQPQNWWCTVEIRRGAAGQTVCSMGSYGSTTWTDTLPGIAYVFVSINSLAVNGGSISITGKPSITALVRGKKIYDPRRDPSQGCYGGVGAQSLGDPATWEFSNNPPLCRADAMMSNIYGGRTDPALIVWDRCAVTADDCDQVLGPPNWATSQKIRYGEWCTNGANHYWCSYAGTTAGSGGGPTGTGTGIVDGTARWNYAGGSWPTSKRYEFNYRFEAKMALADLFSTIDRHFIGVVFPDSNGKFLIECGKPYSLRQSTVPVFQDGETHSLEFLPVESHNACNRVEANYTDPTIWDIVPLDPIDAPGLTDTDELRVTTCDLSGFQVKAQAHRVAVFMLNARLSDLPIQFTTFAGNDRGLQYLDVFGLVKDRYGLTTEAYGSTGKLFYVIGLERSGQDLTITAMEYSDELFSEAVLADLEWPDTDLPKPSDVPGDVTGLTGQDGYRVAGKNGILTGAFTWTAPAGALIAEYGLLIETITQTLVAADDFTDAAWIKTGASTAPEAGLIVFGGTGMGHQVYQAAALAGDAEAFMIQMRARNTSAVVNIRGDHGNGSAGTECEVTTEWQTFITPCDMPEEEWPLYAVLYLVSGDDEIEVRRAVMGVESGFTTIPPVKTTDYTAEHLEYGKIYIFKVVSVSSFGVESPGVITTITAGEHLYLYQMDAATDLTLEAYMGTEEAKGSTVKINVSWTPALSPYVDHYEIRMHPYTWPLPPFPAYSILLGKTKENSFAIDNIDGNLLRGSFDPVQNTYYIAVVSMNGYDPFSQKHYPGDPAPQNPWALGDIGLEFARPTWREDARLLLSFDGKTVTGAADGGTPDLPPANEYNIVGYKLIRFKEGVTVDLGIIPSRRFVDIDVPPGTWLYKMRAVNSYSPAEYDPPVPMNQTWDELQAEVSVAYVTANRVPFGNSSSGSPLNQDSGFEYDSTVKLLTVDEKLVMDETHDHEGGIGAPIAEGALSLSDVTTGDVSATKHGFTPKAPNDTAKFLRGDGVWAVTPGVSVKIGSFTRDTSAADGTQAVTGVGFQPKAVELLAVVDGTPEMSVGLDDGTTHHVLFNAHNYTAEAFSFRTLYSIYLAQTTGVYCVGVVQSLDSDGFTINWTKNGAKTGTATILYRALK